MSTTDTDFWSAIDSRQDQDDTSQQPSADASGDQPRPGSSTADSGDDQGSGAAQRGESSPSSEAENGSARPTSGQVSRPADTSSGKSKSQRIREFLADRPEVRNRDVVDALAEHGVTAADVGNVRSQLRKKAEKQQRAKARAAGEGGDAPRPRAAGRGRPAARAQAGPAAAAEPVRESAAAPSGEIAMTEIEAGLTFIEQAGGIERARQVVDLIARIRAVSLTGR